MKEHEKPLSLEYAIKQVRPIVGRCHVGDSLEAVFKAVRESVKPAFWALIHPSKKVTVLQACRIVHTENRSLYKSVMLGRF